MGDFVQQRPEIETNQNIEAPQGSPKLQLVISREIWNWSVVLSKKRWAWWKLKHLFVSSNTPKWHIYVSRCTNLQPQRDIGESWEDMRPNDPHSGHTTCVGDPWSKRSRVWQDIWSIWVLFTFLLHILVHLVGIYYINYFVVWFGLVEFNVSHEKPFYLRESGIPKRLGPETTRTKSSHLSNTKLKTDIWQPNGFSIACVFFCKKWLNLRWNVFGTSIIGLEYVVQNMQIQAWYGWWTKFAKTLVNSILKLYPPAI